MRVASNSAVVLGDTMGELRKFYSLADVVFVGRSLVDLGARQHGSDMIEPAALGKAVVVGPFTGNFAEAMLKLRQAQAIVEVADGSTLRRSVETLLANPVDTASMGRRAQEVVLHEKGATVRHARDSDASGSTTVNDTGKLTEQFTRCLKNFPSLVVTLSRALLCWPHRRRWQNPRLLKPLLRHPHRMKPFRGRWTLPHLHLRNGRCWPGTTSII